MSAIADAQEQLNHGWRSLQRHWQATCGRWKDSQQRQFERRFWQEFERTVPATLKGIEQLAKVIAQAQRELGE